MPGFGFVHNPVLAILGAVCPRNLDDICRTGSSCGAGRPFLLASTREHSSVMVLENFMDLAINIASSEGERKPAPSS